MAKKVILYGNADCPDCMVVKNLFDEAGIHYGYVDVLGGLAHLKKFLAVRDSHPTDFKAVVEGGGIGIPTVVVDDTELYMLHGAGPDTDLSPFKG